MSIKKVKIENFTVFEKIDIDFASGVNVIIGENGTGKTHLMKLLYSMLQDSYASDQKNHVSPLQVNSMIENYFDVPVNKLISSKKGMENVIQIKCDDNEISMDILKKRTLFEAENILPTLYGKVKYLAPLKKVPIYIPAKDMLTHSKGFMSMYDKFDMPFDKTYYDIISKSLLPNLKVIPKIGKAILPKLENIIGGKVIVENDTFFIEKTNGNKIKFSVEAEGIKKIAIIWQLIMNENITKDSILFWDEPEANINPSLMKDIAAILLELSRNGVQIFVATHNYVFAKYIEILMNDSNNVAFHALYKTENEGVQCETEKKFSLLTHNAIREENINLYDAEMKKEFEE